MFSWCEAAEIYATHFSRLDTVSNGIHQHLPSPSKEEEEEEKEETQTGAVSVFKGSGKTSEILELNKFKNNNFQRF